MKSVAMFMAALVNHITVWLMHLAPGSLVQKARVGMQANIEPNTVQMV